MGNNLTNRWATSEPFSLSSSLSNVPDDKLPKKALLCLYGKFDDISEPQASHTE